MLLVFGRVGGDSFRNLDRREVASPFKATFLTRTRIPPNATKVCLLCFENLQDGSHSTHTATHPLSGGVGGGNTISTHTMLLAFNRGGPGSCHSRQRSGVISLEETRFYPAKHSKSQELDSALSEQRSSLKNHTQDETSPTRLLRRRSMTSTRRQTLLSFIWGCDDCPSIVCCPLLLLLLAKKQLISHVTASGLLAPYTIN